MTTTETQQNPISKPKQKETKGNTPANKILNMMTFNNRIFLILYIIGFFYSLYLGMSVFWGIAFIFPVHWLILLYQKYSLQLKHEKQGRALNTKDNFNFIDFSNEEKDEKTIACSKCGAQMKPNSPFCMSCGKN